MNEDYSWLYNELQNVKTFVLNNKMLYPTYQNKDTVLNINLWIDSKTDNYMSDLCPGYCLKEKDKLTDWKLNTKNDVKLYDIFISPTMLRKSIENIAKERFTLEEALLSTLVHEFTHAISIGFDDFIKDEFYTDFYAKEILSKLKPNMKFYTPYPYNDVYRKAYCDIGKSEKPDESKARNIYYKQR